MRVLLQSLTEDTGIRGEYRFLLDYYANELEEWQTLNAGYSRPTSTISHIMRKCLG